MKVIQMVAMFVVAMATAACVSESPALRVNDGVSDAGWRGGPSQDWFVNWDKALAEANKTGKALFILNTGSDWCVWCKRLKANVLDKPEFAKFAREKLVLVYLDSPSRNPLGKEQKAHNRLVARSLPFSGGVPNVLVMTAKGEKLGSVGGGGLALDEYLEKLRGILATKGDEVRGKDAKRLFTEGYAVLAAELAARRAALPPVTKEDFKAKLTGVAVVDDNRRNKHDEASFVPPETSLTVPFGKTVLFRVEYDFPEGYEARVWVRDHFCDDGKTHSGYFGSNPSGLYKGKGTEYGFLSLLDRGKACRLKSVRVKTNTDPEFDDYPHGWTILTATVDLDFQEKPSDWDAKKTAESRQLDSKQVMDALRERRRKSKEEAKTAMLEPLLPFADAVRKAKDGDGAGLYSLALHYARGVDIAQDGTRAMKYLQKSIDAGNGNAALLKALFMEKIITMGDDQKDGKEDAPQKSTPQSTGLKSEKRLLDFDIDCNPRIYKYTNSRYLKMNIKMDAPRSVTNDVVVAETRDAYLKAKSLGCSQADEEMARFERHVSCIREMLAREQAKEDAWRERIGTNVRLAQEMLGEEPAKAPEYERSLLSLNMKDDD